METLKVTYKDDFERKYMLLQPGREEDSFVLQMMLENCIRGLLPFEKRLYNGEIVYYYDITGKHSLEDKIKKQPMKEDEIRKLLQGLYGVIKELNSYFLDATGILTDPMFIYENEEEVYFCYVPIKREQEGEKEWSEFAEKLLDLADPDCEEAIYMVYEFYQQIKESTKTISGILEDLLREQNPVRNEEEPEKEEELPVWHELPEEEPENMQKRGNFPDITAVILFGISLIVSLCYLILCIKSGVWKPPL